MRIRRRRRRKATRSNPKRRRVSRARPARANPKHRRRKNPAKGRRRRARRNPAASTVKGLRQQAKAMGIKTTGKKAALRARVVAARSKRADDLRAATGRSYGISAKKKDPKRVAAGKKAARTRARKAGKKGARKTKRRMTRAGALRKAQRAHRLTGRYARSARASLKRSRSKPRRRIARTYLAARGIARRVKAGHIRGSDAKLARAMGLTKINPSIKGIAKDVGALMIPVVLPGAASFIGVMAAAQWAGSKLAERVTNVHLRRAAVPVTGLAISGAAYGVLKMSKSAKVQRAAGAVFIGGAIGSLLLALLHTEMGQKLAMKLKLPITLVTPTEGQVVATSSQAAQVASGDVKGVAITPAMVGAYAVIKDYMGAVQVHESPGNWYGRSDMGAYVGKGAQNSLGAYAASDFPIHDAGPGDNVRNSARLLSGLGDIALKDTPLGTEIVGLGGVFDGESSI